MQKLHIDIILDRVRPNADITCELVQILDQLPLANTPGHPMSSLREDVWVAGGAIRRTIMGESVAESDIDLFFRSEEALNKYKDRLIASGWKDFTEGVMNISFSIPMEIITGRDKE